MCIYYTEVLVFDVAAPSFLGYLLPVYTIGSALRVAAMHSSLLFYSYLPEYRLYKHRLCFFIPTLYETKNLCWNVRGNISINRRWHFSSVAIATCY